MPANAAVAVNAGLQYAVLEVQVKRPHLQMMFAVVYFGSRVPDTAAAVQQEGKPMRKLVVAEALLGSFQEKLQAQVRPALVCNRFRDCLGSYRSCQLARESHATRGSPDRCKHAESPCRRQAGALQLSAGWGLDVPRAE